MIDSHVHLNATEFDEILDETIHNALAVHVNGFICIGYDPITNRKAIAIAEHYPSIFCTVGFHPEVAKGITEEDFKELEGLLHHPKVVGIGECGLDYYWDKSTIVEQKQVFQKQIELANKTQLPLIIHMRESAHDTLEFLQHYKLPSTEGVMHCYSGSVEMVSDFLKLNLYISLAGPVTFKNAVVPKEVAKIVPIERLLIETDAPYLAPVPYRGKQNTPAYLPNTLKMVATLRGLSEEFLDVQTEENTKRLFNISLPK